jgi:ABC-type glycerol-3-phosphate transport system substrate-binding protein
MYSPSRATLVHDHSGFVATGRAAIDGSADDGDVRIMRRNVLSAVLAVAAMVAVTSCGGGGGDAASGTTTLTYLTFETPSLTAAFWDSSIAAAEAQVAGVKIKKIVAPSPDRDGYAKQLQATGQFPDLLQSISPSNFVGANLLTPYDPSWVNSNFLLPEGNALGGKVYIPPTNSQIIPLVFYNKTLFRRAGLDPQSPPRTWAQFLEACAKLKASGSTPIELAGAEPWSASMPLVGLISADVLGKDAGWLTKRYAHQTAFADAGVVAAVSKYRGLVKDGYFASGALGVKYEDAIKSFTSGKSAMFPMGSWLLGSLPKDKAADFAAFPVPTDDGSVVIPFNVGGSMAISAKAPDVAKATAFAQAWSLNPQNLKLLIETDGAFPMLKGKTLKDYGVTVSKAFTDSYALVTQDNTKVDSIGWVTNDNALPPGLNDKFYAMSQKLFTSDDVQGALKSLDGSFDEAAPK